MSSVPGISNSGVDRRAIQYCLSYPLVLTRRCGNSCGYCRFPYGPSHPLISLKQLRTKIRHAINDGAVQLELISGEKLNGLLDVRRTLTYYGMKSYPEYLTHVLSAVERFPSPSPLYPLLNVGNLKMEDLERMRARICAFQILLETMDPDVQTGTPHAMAPSKDPERRLETILNCGRLSIPVSTGMMVGLGEDDISQVRLCEIIAGAHERYGHIQSFEIQTFRPKSGTPMEHEPPVSAEDLLNAVQLVRDLLPSEISVVVKAQEHPRLLSELLEAGVDDFGSVSVSRFITTPEEQWQNLLRDMHAACVTEECRLEPRLPIHHRFFSEPFWPSFDSNRLQTAKDRLSRISIPAESG